MGHRGAASPKGIAAFSDLIIARTLPDDEDLYRTGAKLMQSRPLLIQRPAERYNTADFGYVLPNPGDGEYVLTLKFAEAYFRGPGQKVFDVKLNGETVVQDLDIFASVGFAAAHDEHIAFTVSGSTLKVAGAATTIRGNKIPLLFAQGQADNPKICAILVSRGSIEQAQELAPVRAAAPPQQQQQQQQDIVADEDWEAEEARARREIKSKPRKVNPYEVSSGSSPLLTYGIVAVVVVVVGAFWKLQSGGAKKD